MKKISMLIAVIITLGCFQLNTISFASGDVATSDITFSSSDAFGGTVAKMTVTSNPEAHMIALIAGKYEEEAGCDGTAGRDKESGYDRGQQFG